MGSFKTFISFGTNVRSGPKAPVNSMEDVFGTSHRISSTGALQDLSISLVVEPRTKARMREWP